MNHRAAVGPPDKFDLIGGLQFKVMFEQGLRAKHKMLDIGCGSLRGGRFFIMYLDPGHYYGIEPNTDLVHNGIEYEMGASLNRIKRPIFSYVDDFSPLWPSSLRFDFILAQSILTHATQAQIWVCLKEVYSVMKTSGKFVATFFESPNNNSNEQGWSPRAEYTYKFLGDTAFEHGLGIERLPYTHPSGQKWVVFKLI